MIDLDLDKNEIYKYLGYNKETQELSEEIKNLVDECIKVVLQTAMPRKVYSKELEIIKDQEWMIDVMPLIGTDIKAHLKDCDSVILMCVTIGTSIDYLINKESKLDMTKAVIIDAVSNVAVEAIADLCEKEIRDKISAKSRYITGRFSPGYGDMPISSQRKLLDILDAERKIGVTLTDTNLMIPRKSITAVMGVSNIPVTGKKASCEHCIMKGQCSFRKRGTTCYE